MCQPAVLHAPQCRLVIHLTLKSFSPRSSLRAPLLPRPWTHCSQAQQYQLSARRLVYSSRSVQASASSFPWFIALTTLTTLTVCSSVIIVSQSGNQAAEAHQHLPKWSQRHSALSAERASHSSHLGGSGQPDQVLTMATEIGPGRHGNLTDEQQLKLRQLWVAVLKVFGVHPGIQIPVANGTGSESLVSVDGGSVQNGEDTNGAEPVSRSGNQDTEKEKDKDKKKKKSRLGLFSRKPRHEDAEGPPTTGVTDSMPPVSSSNDSEDKYGQDKDFHLALTSQTPEELRSAFWSMVKHDHPDDLLLRFLRARKWDVDKALVMLISTMHWRGSEMHVDDDVIKVGEGGALEATKSNDEATRKEAEDFLAQLRIGKSYLHGLDKDGRPMCFVNVRLHRQGEQSEKSLERYTVYIIETARLLLSPPIDTAAIVFDMTGFSMANMDYAPVKFMIKCFEANYPESLGVVLVHKSPWIFQRIWTIIRGWLDPVVAGKVHFTKTIEELEQFVPRTRIPQSLGGEEAWEYKYQEPSPNENDLMLQAEPREKLLTARAVIVKEFERSTLSWSMSAPQVGSEVSLQAERDGLAKELKSNYWLLDPYVRARTIYDRIGILQKNGQLEFYPDKPGSDTAVVKEKIAETAAAPNNNSMSEVD